MTEPDIVLLNSYRASVDVIPRYAMYGQIASKPRARPFEAPILRPGGRLVVSHPEGLAFVDWLRTTRRFVHRIAARAGKGFQFPSSPWFEELDIPG